MNDENPYESPKSQESRSRFNDNKTFRILTGWGYGIITLGLILVLLSQYFIFMNRDRNLDLVNRIRIGKFILYGGTALDVLGIFLVLAAILMRINSKKEITTGQEDE